MAESYYVSQHKIDESYKDGMEFGEIKGRNEGIAIGEQRGRNEGIQIGKMDMIQRMYENDMSVSMIAKCSGMNVGEV